MKKQTIVTSIKRIVFGSVVSSLMFLSANASVSPVRAYDISVKSHAEVKYSGIDKNQLHTIQVKYSNPTGANFTLIITDANNELVFRGSYSDKDFNKTFKFPKDESNKLSFVIEDVKAKKSEQYNVSFETIVIENAVVSKS
ncbi:MAG: hypothetical protein KGZ74_01615 [Chitinophagaceae bacterium]|uniref:hypothetical protein n=1 Tax=Sediminibacterium sp. TEGAF015 TaxID=575378 RepID=UPI001BBD240A|nr:hypothetical protein [Sediminibacterium sp. TEGAF015]MBS4063223.1 hypothetical protein [Chitinophagaceae bacterium]BDQ12997.1 hypothetical protein TEGAF0_22140 [Sediminibacterium sp. TEGAF015]